MICPKCNKSILKKEVDEKKKKGKKKKKTNKSEDGLIKEEIKPSEFETKMSTLSSKMEGKVRVKKKTQGIEMDKDKIELQKGEYIKLLGVVSIDRKSGTKVTL